MTGQKCELDSELFVCCKCGLEFNHTQGTWLPVGEDDRFMTVASGSHKDPPIVLNFDLRPPEVITSDHFTCYDCAE